MGKPKKKDTKKNSIVSLTMDGVTKSKMPSYVKINGVFYEKLKTGTVDVTIDVSPDVSQKLKSFVKDKHFVNEQEAIRYIIRTMIEEKNL